MTALPWHGQLSHVALCSTRISDAVNFYVDHLGMTRDSRWEDGRERLGWGLGDPVLELVDAPTPQLDHFAIEIADPAELDELARRVADRGLAPRLLAEDPRHPSGFSLVDPDGRVVEFHGRIDRSGERSATSGWRPQRLQHITLAASNHAETHEFYTSVLGLSVSDRMGDVFSWLRCGSEHHTVAIVESRSKFLVDHFSFDLGGWMDFRTWCDRLASAGVVVDWGPGRHGPGNNLFLMFSDLDGYHIELSAEMESFADGLATYGPRVWEPNAQTVNRWGTVPSWRAPQVA